MISHFKPKGSAFFRSRSAVWSLVLLGLVCSAWMYGTAKNDEANRIVDDMKRRADMRHTLTRETINGFVESVHALRDFIGMQPAISAEQFRVLSQNAIQRHPGFLHLQWVPLVPHSEREHFEANRRVLSPNFKITERDAHGEYGPAAHRTEYAPLSYLEPEAGLDRELGFDLSSSVVLPYLTRARLSGNLIVTRKIQISTAAGKEDGVLMIDPVFALGSKASANGQFLGYVVATFRTGDFFAHSWRRFRGPVTDVLFLDAAESDPARRIMYYYPAEADRSTERAVTEAEYRSTWYRELPLIVGEKTWLLLYRTKPGWLEAQRTLMPIGVLISGVLTSVLFALYLRGAVRRAELIEREVAERTTELRHIQGQLQDDIRRREEAEDLLRASEQQLQGLLENSPNAIFFKDTDGRYLTVNKRFAELHGRTREEFIGKSDPDVFPPEVGARNRMSDTRVISSGKPVELEDSIMLPDGAHTSIVHKFPLIDGSGQVRGLCGIATDITERKRAEAEIRESRRQLESLLGQLPGMAFRYVNDGKFTPAYVSRGALGLTGHTSKEFLEKQVTLEDVIHPEDRELLRNTIAAAVRKRRSFEVEYRLIDRNGQMKWVLERGQGIYDDEGNLLFIEGLAIDITQRKDAEAEKLLVERRLLEGQKLESIGVLAGGIAHDFNNLLTGIIGNANLASLELPSNSSVQQNLKQIETASQRAAELCQQMLAYAGKGRFVVQRVEVSAMIESTVPLLRASISKRATVHFQLQPELPSIMADATQVRQIVMNLVLNASESLGDRDGDVVLATSLVRPPRDFFEGAVLTPPDINLDFVRVEVRDTGSGMTPETMAKIFDPFFTTKFAGRGLGLAAVLGIIRSHRGGLKVRSSPGKGSTFSVFLPAVSGQHDTTPPRRTSATPFKQEGMALVIDDEDHVLKVTAGMLVSCGLAVEMAHDGYEGVDLYRAKPHKFDLVVLDMTMPRLSGEETLALLREVNPDVRVLFMSGYNRREVVDSMADSRFLSFIQKPFTLDSLREQLKVMLN